MSTPTRSRPLATAPVAPAAGPRPFAGTWRLVRLAARRDRILLPVWILALVGVAAATAPSVLELYDTQADRLAYAATWAGSVVALLFNGPAAGPDPGAVAVAETYTLLAILTPLMSIFAVVRHTRQNEETGRAELLASAVVGRYAGLAAALTITLTADLLVGAGVAAALLAAGLPASGSVMAGAAVAGMGASFAVVAAVTAQIASTARTASGIASAVLALAFVARGIGDAFGTVSDDGMRITSSWLSWLSPLGWANQTFPYVENDLRPLLLTVGFVLVGAALAAVLAAHRDVGTGMVPDRRGPASAARGLRSGLGLAWRLHRGALLGWLTAAAILGLAMGAVADEVDDMLAGNPDAVEIMAALGGSDRLTDAYLAVVLSFLAFLAAGFGVQGVLRMRAEEAAGTLEPVLAGAISRYRWALGHLVWIGSGAAAMLAVGGLTMGLTYGLATGDVPGEVLRLLAAAAVHLPAVAVLTAAVLLVFAVLPRGSAVAGWGLLISCLLMAQLGEILDLPQGVLNTSPFTHVPAAPAAEVETAPLVWLAAVAVVLVVAALGAVRRRDVPG